MRYALIFWVTCIFFLCSSGNIWAQGWQDYYSPPSNTIQHTIVDTMGPAKINDFRVVYEFNWGVIDAGNPAGIMHLTWSKPKDYNWPNTPGYDFYNTTDVADGPGVGGDAYLIFRAVDGAQNISTRPNYQPLVVITNRDTTFYNDSDILLGGKYEYLIVPFDIYGNSGASTHSTEDPSNDTLTAPDYVKNLQARLGFTASSVELNFFKPRTQSPKLSYEIAGWYSDALPDPLDDPASLTSRRVLGADEDGTHTTDGISYYAYSNTSPPTGTVITMTAIEDSVNPGEYVMTAPAGHTFEFDYDAKIGLVRMWHTPPVDPPEGDLTKRFWSYAIRALDDEGNYSWVGKEGCGMGEMVFNSDFNRGGAAASEAGLPYNTWGWHIISDHDYYLYRGSPRYPYSNRGIDETGSDYYARVGEYANVHPLWCATTADTGTAYHFADFGGTDMDFVRNQELWLKNETGYFVNIRPGDNYTVGMDFKWGEMNEDAENPITGYHPPGPSFNYFEMWFKFYNGLYAGATKANRYDYDWDMKREKFTYGNLEEHHNDSTGVYSFTVDSDYTDGWSVNPFINNESDCSQIGGTWSSGECNVYKYKEDVYHLAFQAMVNNAPVQFDKITVIPEKTDMPTCLYVKDNTPPTTIKDLRARALYTPTNRADLSWTMPEDDIGIRYYYVYRVAVTTGEEWKTIEENLLIKIDMDSPPPAFTHGSFDIEQYTDGGLSDGGTYFYAVVSEDRNRNRSDISNISKVKAGSPFDLVPPSDSFYDGMYNNVVRVYYPNNSTTDNALPINPSAGSFDLDWDAEDSYLLSFNITASSDLDSYGDYGLSKVYHIVRRKDQPVGNRLTNFGFENADMTGWDLTGCTGTCDRVINADRLFGIGAFKYENTTPGTSMLRAEAGAINPLLNMTNSRTGAHGLYYTDRLTVGAWVLVMPESEGSTVPSGQPEMTLRFQDGPLLMKETFDVQTGIGWYYLRMEVPPLKVNFEDYILDEELGDVTVDNRTWYKTITGGDGSYGEEFGEAFLAAVERVARHDLDSSFVSVRMATPKAEEDVQVEYRYEFLPDALAPQDDLDISFWLRPEEREVNYNVFLTNYEELKPVHILFEEDYTLSYMDENNVKQSLGVDSRWHEEVWTKYRISYSFTDNTWSLYRKSLDSDPWTQIVNAQPAISDEILPVDQMTISSLSIRLNGESEMFIDDITLLEGGYEDLELLIGGSSGIGDFYFDDISLDNGWPVGMELLYGPADPASGTSRYLKPTGVEDNINIRGSIPEYKINFDLEYPGLGMEHGKIEESSDGDFPKVYYYATFPSDLAGFPAEEEINPHLDSPPMIYFERNEGRLAVNTRVEVDTEPPEFLPAYTPNPNYWYDLNYDGKDYDTSGFGCADPYDLMECFLSGCQQGCGEL